MREFTHPPGPGARRSVGNYQLNEATLGKFLIQVETIQACGLIAEVVKENSNQWIQVYATRRVKKVRRG